MTRLSRNAPTTCCGRPLSLDEDTRRSEVRARRNVLFGLWATGQLGPPHAEREA